MNAAELLNLSLEQTAATLGDPTPVVFDEMYKRFPQLAQFRAPDNNDWENYMMQEILMNFMQFQEDRDTALSTIRDMYSHHQLIGVSVDIFKGMYQVLYDVLSPLFSGPHKDDMQVLWQRQLADINDCIAECEARFC